MICISPNCSLYRNIAKRKAIIGLIFKSIPTVEELMPESAYKLRNKGKIVNNIAMVSIQK